MQEAKVIVELFDVNGPDKQEVTAAFFSLRFTEQGGDIARVLGRENYVLRKNGVLIGLGSAALNNPGEASLTMLEIEEQHRGEGYGTFLLETMEERLALQGVCTVRVPMVSPQAAEAVPFLESRGYSFMPDEAGDRTVPYMEKQLAQDAS